MDILTLAIVVLLSVGISVAGTLIALLYLGMRKRQKAERSFAATVPATTKVVDMTPVNPPAPSFDPSPIIESIRIVSAACEAQGVIVQQHAEALHRQHQSLLIHDNALMAFQRQQAIEAHAIAMLQEGVRDLTAITSQGLPSGKMYPSVNEFLAKAQEVPKVPLTEAQEKIIVEDNPDDPHQEPDVPPKMPPPFPKSKIQPKGRKRG